MVSHINQVTFDCRDSYALSLFWAQVTGYPEHPEVANAPDHEENFIGPGGGHPGLLFITVPDPEKRVKNRVHLDISPEDRTRDEEVERLTALGATVFEDHRRPDGSGWVTMLDPEGNEFCVERSKAEREASS